jgi:hypothetical protein
MVHTLFSHSFFQNMQQTHSSVPSEHVNRDRGISVADLIMESALGSSSTSNITDNISPSSWILLDWVLSLHILFLWILPILCSLSGLSFVMAVCFQWSTSDASIFAGLIGLFLVECLVPLTAMVSTFLYFILASTGQKLVTTTISVWFFSFCSSTYIRSLLYPQLGQG